MTLFLLAFIPLYPKIPLLDITQTWVSVRFEDILVGFVAVALLATLIRDRKLPKSPLTRPIGVYWIVGLISLANALLFIFPNLSGVLFPHLAVLHYVRRLEYMMLFFVAYEAFKNKPLIKPLLWTLIGSYVLIILYGFGQKFLGFPAFLTMNEEFAKGVPLKLPPTARFPSTFGGHYDLAAYLILVIPIIGSLIFSAKKVWHKLVFLFLTLLGFEMLLFTASRVSFGVYLVCMSFMLFWQKKIRLIIPMIVLSMLMMTLTSGASERFYKTFSVSDVIVDLSTGKPIGTLNSTSGSSATLEPIASPAEDTLPRGSEFINLGTADSSTSGQISEVLYYKSIDVDGAGDIATFSGSFLIQKALVYDISITTRFQGQWPKAMEAFKRNYLLGSGYSSLSVAVDGDYHRMLGETGILGAIAFLGIFAAAFQLFLKYKETLEPVKRAFVIGLFSGIVGLLVNAVLIDVFEASKVAFTMWSLLGMAVAMLVGEKQVATKYLALLKHIATRPLAYVFYLFISVFVIWGIATQLYFLGDDFTWLRWAAESNISDVGRFFTQSEGFWYRPIPKLWYYTLFSVVWLKPAIYHAASLFLLFGTSFFIYRLLLLCMKQRMFAWIGALVFAVAAVHHENVYWISGQSSLLAGFFLMAAVYIQFESRALLKRVPVWVTAIVVWMLTIASMFSYDGMVIAPVVVTLLSFFKQKKSFWTYVPLLCIPVYLFMRQGAMALAPAGDYGYKVSTFFINTISNLLGYTVSFFGGPSVVEKWNQLRVLSRPLLKPMTGVFAVFGVAVIMWAWKKRDVIRKHTDVWIWFLAYLVSFTAYAPLGGMADRYVYIPSMFLVVGLVIGISKLWQTTRSKFVKILICIVCVGYFVWNVMEVKRLGGDWLFASKSAEHALQVIKKETYPPKDVKTFFFVDMPIRYGSAWIFPTGINDAIWHMYRTSPYRVFTMPSIEDAYNFQMNLGDREVFVFDNYELKRGVREVQNIQ
ncbi:MAG: hypothetical protein WAV51_02730 [Microgenomates group bacterium]